MAKAKSKGIAALRSNREAASGRKPCPHGESHPACSRNGGPYACEACLPEIGGEIRRGSGQPENIGIRAY